MKPNAAASVGDDFIDLLPMLASGLAIAVKNARPEVKKVAHYITPHSGGEGALRDAVEFILKTQGNGRRSSKPTSMSALQACAVSSSDASTRFNLSCRGWTEGLAVCSLKIAKREGPNVAKVGGWTSGPQASRAVE